MKGITTLLSSLLLIITMVSCSGDNPATNSENATSSNAVSSIQNEDAPKQNIQNEAVEKTIKPRSEWSLADLSFDNGMKWKANEETSHAIESMDDAMEVFLLTEDHSLEEYNEFAALLALKYQNIFKVCTMRGAGHDELHKMLVKVNFYLEKMASENIDEVKKGCDQLHKQLHLYSVYFE